MPTPHGPASDSQVLRGKLRRLIAGRAALIGLLVVVKSWKAGILDDLLTGAASLNVPVNRPLIYLLAASVAATTLYSLLLWTGRRLRLQARAQLLIDIVLVSFLVSLTGDTLSPYITLYIVLISVGGFFLNKTETLVISLLCSLAFAASALPIGDAAATDEDWTKAVQMVGMNIVAILLVGLLSARLAERRRIAEKLRHSEESFADLHILHERIVESIPTGLITADLEGRIYAINRAAAEITRIPAREAVGQKVFGIFGPEAERAAAAFTNGSPDPSEPPITFETVFGDGNGNGPRVTAACAVVPLLGKTGEVTGLIVTVQDVTRVRALEETVRRSDRLAAVGRMAAGLAHEIRNPLGSMSSALQFLQERDARPDEDGALMSVVLRESDRLNGIITDFLAFARPAANGLDPDRTADVDVGKALCDCLSLIRHSPDAGDAHEFECIIPDEPVIIRANESEIKQVFWNLAQNGIQAMPDGGKLTGELERVSPGTVRVTVRDTGTGIDEDILEHLFEPFTSGSGGTGLGLSIVYNIVRAHNGRISVQSKKGEGTKFAVEFRSDGREF